MIRTERLRLIPASIDALNADLEGPASLAGVLGVTVPSSWPPELYDTGAVTFTRDRLHHHPDEDGWWMYYFAGTGEEGGPLVGCGGYKGPPADGVVEVGYSILEPFRRRGYATEATEALCRRAFDVPEVSAVIAETFPELAPSIGVLERCGFTLLGEGSAPGVLRFQLTREEWTTRS
jgi:[ribosomal protein S5]-alanine N-acetyltransferase